jgi:hypothetical protein
MDNLGFYLALCGPIFLGLFGIAVGLFELRRIRARKAKAARNL